MKHKFAICIILVLFLFRPSQSQSFELGIECGVSSYFGDLAPLSWKFGFTGGQLVTGYNFGLVFNQHFTLRFSYMNTEIAASDDNALDSFLRRKRNLNFSTEIQEYGINFESTLFGWSKSKISRTVQPYVTLGINYFMFNPVTNYKGTLVNLQPLGTEGQGMTKYPERQYYDLSQFNIPFGGGIKIILNKNLWIGMGLKYRMTFTDYLDDVSNTYVELEELARLNGMLSAELSYRTDELSGNNLVPNDLVGTYRGNPRNNDWYLTTYVTIAYKWKKKKLKNRRNKYSNCPNDF